MRLRQPRILPVTEADWTDDSRPVLAANSARGPVLNVFATIARHPKLLKRWVVFANHVLNGSTLPARERELVILRTGFLCRSGYEWAQHAAIGRAAGLTDAEIERLTVGSTADGWSDGDRALLQATEQLVTDHFVDDPTWTALADHVEPATADGSGLRSRAIHAGVDGAEHLRRPARGLHRTLPRRPVRRRALPASALIRLLLTAPCLGAQWSTACKP